MFRLILSLIVCVPFVAAIAWMPGSWLTGNFFQRAVAWQVCTFRDLVAGGWNGCL